MHQVTIPVGKTATADAVVNVGTALATAVPALSVGINVGNNTGKPWAVLERDLYDLIDRLLRESKQGVAAGVILRAAMAVPGQSKPGIVVDAATNALAAETGLCIVRNTTGNLDGQTEYVLRSFIACVRVMRQQVFMALMAGIVK